MSSPETRIDVGQLYAEVLARIPSPEDALEYEQLVPGISKRLELLRTRVELDRCLITLPIGVERPRLDLVSNLQPLKLLLEQLYEYHSLPKIARTIADYSVKSMMKPFLGATRIAALGLWFGVYLATTSIGRFWWAILFVVIMEAPDFLSILRPLNQVGRNLKVALPQRIVRRLVETFSGMRHGKP